MQINEFQAPIMFHTTLNPLLWQGDELRQDVRAKLLELSREFIKTLKMDVLPLQDIVITGSNTNLTYTPQSDLDLHLVVDMSKVYGGGDLVTQFFDSKRRLWDATYDIKIHDIEVEVYVEDTAETVEGNAYSLMTNEWITRKDITRTKYNDRSVRAKYNYMSRQIERVLERADELDDITRLMHKLKNYRQTGLDKHGEFSTENLVFKALRNNGWLDEITAKKIDLTNTKLSLN
jgi:hypothetical protein